MSTVQIATTKDGKSYLTPNQRALVRRVALSYAADPVAWCCAESHGERVTFASLYYRGVLDRRARRGNEGEANAAYEYRLTASLRAEVDAHRARKAGGAPTGTDAATWGGMSTTPLPPALASMLAAIKGARMSEQVSLVNMPTDVQATVNLLIERGLVTVVNGIPRAK